MKDEEAQQIIAKMLADFPGMTRSDYGWSEGRIEDFARDLRGYTFAAMRDAVRAYRRASKRAIPVESELMEHYRQQSHVQERGPRRFGTTPDQTPNEEERRQYAEYYGGVENMPPALRCPRPPVDEKQAMHEHKVCMDDTRDVWLPSKSNVELAGMMRMAMGVPGLVGEWLRDRFKGKTTAELRSNLLAASLIRALDEMGVLDGKVRHD